MNYGQVYYNDVANGVGCRTAFFVIDEEIVPWHSDGLGVFRQLFPDLILGFIP